MCEWHMFTIYTWYQRAGRVANSPHCRLSQICKFSIAFHAESNFWKLWKTRRSQLGKILLSWAKNLAQFRLIFCAFWEKLDFAENPETRFFLPETRFFFSWNSIFRHFCASPKIGRFEIEHRAPNFSYLYFIYYHL